jgi:hypothetical protein
MNRFISPVCSLSYVTVLAKRDHFMVKQTFENGAKIKNYRKAYATFVVDHYAPMNIVDCRY